MGRDPLLLPRYESPNTLGHQRQTHHHPPPTMEVVHAYTKPHSSVSANCLFTKDWPNTASLYSRPPQIPHLGTNRQFFSFFFYSFLLLFFFFGIRFIDSDLFFVISYIDFYFLSKFFILCFHLFFFSSDCFLLFYAFSFLGISLIIFDSLFGFIFSPLLFFMGSSFHPSFFPGIFSKRIEGNIG